MIALDGFLRNCRYNNCNDRLHCIKLFEPKVCDYIAFKFYADKEKTQYKPDIRYFTTIVT